MEEHTWELKLLDKTEYVWPKDDTTGAKVAVP